MGKSTDYSINLYYKLRDEASRGLDRMAAKAKGTSQAFNGLKTAVVSYFGGRAAYNALIKFNDGVEQTKIQIGGMMALAKQTPFTRELGNANKMYDSLSRKAAALPGTTKDYVDMLGMIAQPAANAGLSMRKLEDLTVGATVASKALGIQADVGARDIGQALRGQYNSKDQLTGAILGSIGYAGEEGRAKFNALSDAKRAAELMRAFKQKQLTEMAAAQGNTWSGMLSTAVDAAQRFFGKVGLSLFERVKKELAEINRWLTVHESQVEAFAKDLGDGLVTGFKVVKEVAKFLVDNRDTFMAIGKVWLATQLMGKMPGGNFGGGLGGIAGLVSARNAGVGFGHEMARDDQGRFTGKVGKVGVLSAVQGAAMAGFLGWEIGKWAQDNIGPVRELQNVLNDGLLIDGGGLRKFRANMAKIADIQEWDKRLTLNQAEFKQQAVEGNQFGALAKMAEFAKNDRAAATYEKQMETLRNQWAGHQALIKQNREESGKLSDTIREAEKQAKFGGLFKDRSEEIEQARKRMAEMEQQTKNATIAIVREQAEYMKAAWPAILGDGLLALKADFFDPLASVFDFMHFGDKNKQPKGGDTHVTINRIEVASEDPDRFVFGLEEVGRRANQARIRARGGL